MLCGCTTTSMASGAASNRKCASITSSPLFIRVAESTEICAPCANGMGHGLLGRDADKLVAPASAEGDRLTR